MKYAPTLILCALVFVAASADLHIDMVYYDPFNARGSEAVLIANTGPHTIDLTGYKLATRTSPQDHTLQGSIAPRSTYLSTYSGWDEHKDNQSWPDADHEQPITLANAGGYVHLTTPQGDILDTVGWKDTEYYLGTPHPGVEKGLALVRVQNTQNNSADFVALTPFSQPEQPADAIALTFEVLNTPPRILNIKIEDDFPQQTGVQLLPTSNGRSVWVNVTVADNNTLAHTTVYVDGTAFTPQANQTTDTVFANATIYAHTTHINVTVVDEEHTVTELVAVEALPAVSLSIPASVSQTITPGNNQNATVIVENTGGAALDLHVRGTPPTRASQLLGRVTYEILGEEYELTSDIREHQIGLAPGQQLTITIRTEATFVPAGMYSGQLVLSGVMQ